MADNTVTLDADTPTDLPPDSDDATQVAAPSRAAAFVTSQWAVAAFAAAAAVVAWWFADRHQLGLLYADARSHLTISRRIIDGTNSGFTQIGTVWLPLPHLVVAPFTYLTEMWRTGSAVVVVNTAALVIEAIALYRIVTDATRRPSAGWIAVIVLCTNPGWLYLHTTALTEPVLFASVLALVAGLAAWARTDETFSSGLIVIFCGLPAAAAVLSRYDGWAYAAAGAVFVAYVAQRRWGRWSYTWRCVRAFVVAPAVAAAWWCWFNWVNWGDPLEFQRGQWSAQAQQDILDRAGLLPDKGNLAASIDTFATASIRGAGTALVAIAAAGMAGWAITRRGRTDTAAVWLLAVVPAGFYILSLFTGQIALRLGTPTDPSMFNLRYGLQMLPAVAAFVGIAWALVARNRITTGIATVAVAVALAATVAPQADEWRDVPVIAEGLQQRDLADDVWDATAELRRLAVTSGDQGVIAMDDSLNPMFGVLGADLDRVAALFDGELWDATLDDLDRVDWIFADHTGDGDALSQAIADDPTFADRFTEVYRAGDIAIYERNDR